jgi:hypothetical protein
MAKKETFVTPQGRLSYPFLTRARDYNRDGNFAYDTGLIVEGEDAAELVAMIDEFMKQAKKESKKPNGNPPYAPVVDAEGDPVPGKFLFKFRVRATWPDGASRQPKFVDADGNNVPKVNLRLGSGTLARIRFLPNLYGAKNKSSGVTLQPVAVQIIELVEYEGTAEGFEPVKHKGGFKAESVKDREAAPDPIPTQRRKGKAAPEGDEGGAGDDDTDF